MYSKRMLSFALLQIFIVALLLLNTIGDSHIASASVYLDGSATSCTNGATTYNPVTRSCGSGSDKVYLDLANFSSNIAAGATNYIRAGSYFRDNPTAHQGSLYITQSGTDDAHRTIVKAYPGEELKAIIGTAQRGATYNSNPGDTTGSGSYNYYPNVVINIAANYVTVYGLKVYGLTYFYGCNYVIVDSCDLGGGGSAIDVGGQGQVVRFNNSYGSVLRNCLVHNSCNASDGDGNGSAVEGYSFTAIIEHNTFYDNWYSDVHTKDSLGQSGRNTEIRYNFFKPSSIYPNSIGITGYNQNVGAAGQLIHHNIFYNKNVGYSVWATPPVDTVYNNTFINCGIDIENASSGGPYNLSVFNNLFYHSTTGNVFLSLYALNYLTASDWNIYYVGGNWNKSAPGGLTWETTLAGWKTFSSLDAASISTNPSFVNASGTNPADFKRTNYTENFAASPYSVHAGAYETGSEIIGYSASSSSSGAVLSPSNLFVVQVNP
jgi:hypothetical protein